MTWIILLLLLIAVVVFGVLNKKQPERSIELPSKAEDGFPYQKNSSLFSPAERSFLGVLEQAIGGEYRIFGKVRIADVASVKYNKDRALWQRAFNRISAKHFDFVVCTSSDLSIVFAIELDDKSHQQSKRQERDNFVVTLCQAISLPLLQVPAQHSYSIQELRSQVSALTSSQPLVHAVGA